MGVTSEAKEIPTSSKDLPNHYFSTVSLQSKQGEDMLKHFKAVLER